MKKVILFLLCLLPALAQAYDAKVKGVYYNIKNGKAEVTKGDEPYSGVITIPSTISFSGKEYPVTRIGYKAFSDCTGLETIYIGERVVSIAGEAFKGCSTLTAVHYYGFEVPESPVNIFEGCPIDKAILNVWSISLSKFEGTLPWSNFGKKLGFIGVVDYDPGTDEVNSQTQLNFNITGSNTCEVAKSSKVSGSITIPATTTINGKSYTVTAIGNNAFSKCTALTSINIPNSVTNIGEYAFFYCTALTSINIPNSVTNIGEYAFFDCSSLTEICIPNNITTISKGVFDGCEAITTIKIPSNVTSIPEGAFAGCTALTCINVVPKNSNYCSINGVLFTKNRDKIYRYPEGKMDSIYSIPMGVIAIGEYAFDGCKSLTDINIPNSVVNIGEGAFDGCRFLSTINIPNSVTTIGKYAFWVCEALTNINLPNSINSIGEEAFVNCSALRAINIPGNLLTIGNGAFYGCENLECINVDNNNPNYSSIDGALFTKNRDTILCYPEGKKNSRYSIPKEVATIGEGAFYNCNSLKTINIPNSVIAIGKDAFHGCESLSEVTCNATDVPKSQIGIFDRTPIENATLYVSSASLPKYKSLKPWSQFGEVKAIDDVNFVSIAGNEENYIHVDDLRDNQEYGSTGNNPVIINDDHKIFNVVDQPPTFPGGGNSLLKYISTHLKYPDSASKAGLQGNVVLRFVILENGAIGDIKITKSLSEDCDEEAVRVIKSLPRFMPGKNQGKAVRVWYNIPVRFTMD